MNKLFYRNFATRLKGSVLYSMGMCLVLATTSTQAFSQAGQLDTTFGNKGGRSSSAAIRLLTGWPGRSPTPAPTERSVRISRTALVGNWFTARR